MRMTDVGLAGSEIVTFLLDEAYAICVTSVLWHICILIHHHSTFRMTAFKSYFPSSRCACVKCQSVSTGFISAEHYTVYVGCKRLS